MTPNRDNPLLNLDYEPALENLGDDYYDQVAAAEFPQHILRFRNDELLPQLGLNPDLVEDRHFIEVFGKFKGIRPFLALRYHGYQFGEYNPHLGDGRGFLYGQVRGVDGALYDFGTKGSGQTPYSRGGDGRLTLKGGVREVLAAEALHALGVTTSRCLSLVETGESLWRGDEPSPTRSSVMIRMSRSHLRFGTFERLYYLKRPDLIKKLLDFVIDIYYQNLSDSSDRYILFYQELVKRIAQLVAQWMAAGFCHGVLNTDNMSITGESFDYGPYGFIPTYDPQFTSAYFDYGGRYSYGNQPLICRLNLEMLQLPLMTVISPGKLEAALKDFEQYYYVAYRESMLKKLGIKGLNIEKGDELLNKTIEVLKTSQIGYHEFFAELANQFNWGWREDSSTILENSTLPSADWETWRELYYQVLTQIPQEKMDEVSCCLHQYNTQTPLLRPIIESVWESIAYEYNWQPFDELVNKLQRK
ncbi:protein adenylyltransferase SelO [Crocosphaera sp. XPORK-15E]|uniref:protein adenylyltransferase SelO n=1 Tax=Crocosphaera sp. XPORK-15E TaxID=3110247 RepID=UPI002B200B84|nr:YdiU family protein [Crocosphaera sp. XPORK-15E]MEA5537260.1 YdiU family protein [Crocosphaera sp. XPORK-15E]